MPRFVMLCLGLALLVGCGGGDPGRRAMRVAFEGLEDLGEHSVYQAWLVVGGEPQSAGRFRVDASTNPPILVGEFEEVVFGYVDGAELGPSNTRLGEDFPFLDDATAFFLTIESAGQDDRIPSANVIAAGTFVDREAVLDQNGLPALGIPGNAALATAAGTVALETPTQAAPNGLNGVWFRNPATGQPSLNLPVAEGDFVYEAWVETPNGLRSLGRFRDPTRRDFNSGAPESMGPSGIGPDVPGQDFAAPYTVAEVPTPDLADGNWRVALCLEPEPDTGPGAAIALLAAAIPTGAIDPATGLSRGEVAMLALNPAQPAELGVSRVGAGFQFSGELGPALGTEAVYGVHAVGGGGAVQTLALLSVEADDSVVRRDGGVAQGVVGTRSLFTLDPTNTGLLGTFPTAGTVTEIFLTLERFESGALATPSPSVWLAGGLLAEAGLLTHTGSATRGLADLSGLSGSFVLRTPTNDVTGNSTDDAMGLWCRRAVFDPEDEMDSPTTLTLPDLPVGWRYELHLENTMTAERLSGGRFRRARGADEDYATHRGRGPDELLGFDVPGQDWVVGRMAGTVPAETDLGGMRVVVTLEPLPDTSAAPTNFVILEGVLPTVGGQSSAPLTNRVASFPTGRVQRP